MGFLLQEILKNVFNYLEVSFYIPKARLCSGDCYGHRLPALQLDSDFSAMTWTTFS